MFKWNSLKNQLSTYSYKDVDSCVAFLWEHPDLPDVMAKYTPAITKALSDVVDRKIPLENLYEHTVNKKNNYANSAGLKNIYDLRFCLDYLMTCLVASIPEKQAEVAQQAFTNITLFICLASPSRDSDRFLGVLSNLVKKERLDPATAALNELKEIHRAELEAKVDTTKPNAYKNPFASKGKNSFPKDMYIDFIVYTDKLGEHEDCQEIVDRFNEKITEELLSVRAGKQTLSELKQYHFSNCSVRLNQVTEDWLRSYFIARFYTLLEMTESNEARFYLDKFFRFLVNNDSGVTFSSMVMQVSIQFPDAGNHLLLHQSASKNISAKVASSVSEHSPNDVVVLNQERPRKNKASQGKDASNYFVPILVVFVIMLCIAFVF